MMTGKPDSMEEVTCDDGQVGSPIAAKNSQPLSRWKGFRLTEMEFSRLDALAQSRGLKVSTLLRVLVQQAVRDVE